MKTKTSISKKIRVLYYKQLTEIGGKNKWKKGDNKWRK